MATEGLAPMEQQAQPEADDFFAPLLQQAQAAEQQQPSQPASAAGNDDFFAPLLQQQEQAAPRQSSKPARSGGGQYQRKLADGIDQAAQRYGLPSEARNYLYAIADIESGFGRNMRGKAIGTEISGDLKHKGDRALGPFQFMTKTAKEYGLADRMDPYASADAAARHLIDAYKQQGNWHDAAVGHHSGAAWTHLGKWGKDYDQKLRQRVGGDGTALKDLPYEQGAPIPRLRGDTSGPTAEAQQAALEGLFTKQVEPGTAQEVPAEHGVVSNLARGAGERSAQLGGGLMEFAGDLGRKLEEKVPLGGFTWEGWLPEYRGPEEYAKYMEGKKDWLQQGADVAKSADLGYEPMTTWQDVKNSWADEDQGALDFLGQLAGFGFEQFFVSAPDMAATVLNLPAYVVARTGELSQARAQADGKEQPDIGDIGVGALTAATSAFVERFGVEKLLHGLKGRTEGLDDAALGLIGNIKNLAGGMAATGGTEAGTEAIQEAIEYLGTNALTKAGVDPAQLADNMLAGAAGGGVPGAAIGGVGRVRERGRAATTRRETAEREENFSQTVDTIPETPQDELAAVRAVADGRKQAGMVLRPESVKAAQDAGLETIEAENGTLVTTPENKQAVQAAEDAGERYKVLGYAEDKATAVKDPGAVLVRPVQADGASPGAQLVSRARLEEARALAQQHAGPDGTVEVITPEDEAVRRVQAQDELDAAQAQEEAAQAQQVAQEEEMFAEQEVRGQEEQTWAARQEQDAAEAQQAATAEEKWAKAPPPATQAAQKLAKKHGVDLRSMEVRGKQITVGDVQKQLAKTKTAAPTKVTKLDAARARKAQEAIEKQEHAERVRDKKAVEAQPPEALGGLDKKFEEAATKLAEKLAAPAKAKAPEVWRVPEDEQYKEAMSFATAEKQPSAAFGESQGALGTALRYIDKRREMDKEVISGGRRPKKFTAPLRTQAVADTAPFIRATRDRIAASAIGKTDEAKRLRQLGSELAKRAANLSERSAAQTVNSVEADVRAWHDAVSKLKTTPSERGAKAEPKTEPATEPQQEPRKMTPADAAVFRGLVEDGVLTPKEALAAVRAKLTPEQAVQRSVNRVGMVDEGISDLGAEISEESGFSIQSGARSTSSTTPKITTKKRRVIPEAARKLRDFVSSVSGAPTKDRPEIRKARKSVPWTLVEHALETNSATGDLLKSLRDNLHTSDPYRYLLGVFADLGMNHVRIRVIPETAVRRVMGDDTAVAGFKGGPNPEVYLSEEALADPELATKHLLHELVHASLNESMRTDHKLALEMDDLRQFAASRLGEYNPATGDGWYGLSDVDEFMAEALTNPDFQAALAKVRTGEATKNLWQRFLSLVRDFLGLPVHADSVLAHVLDAAPRLMLTQERSQDIATRALQHKNVAPYISQATPDAIETARAVMNATEVRRAARSPAAVVGSFVRMDGTAKDLLNRLRPHKLALQTTDQLVRGFGRLMPALQTWQRANQERTSIARTAQRTAESLNTRWRELERRNPRDGQRLAKLMRDSTMQESDPRTAASPLHKNWQALSKEAQAVYTEVEKFYDGQRQEMKTALLQRLVEFKVAHPNVRGIQTRLTAALNKVPTPTAKEVDAAFNAEIARAPKDLVSELDKARDAAKQVIKLTGVRGPYFPLRRWGDYVISGESPKGAQYTEFFETESAAQAELSRRRAAGYQMPNGVQLKRDWSGSGLTESAPQLLAMLNSKFNGDPAIQGQVQAAVIQLLAETNLRKSELQRRNVEGASLNMRRAFAERAFAGSWALADAKTAFARAEALQVMDTQASSVALGQVVKELRLRENKALSDRKIGKLDQVISKFGFAWMLLSPSYSIVNATQVPLVAVPYLSAKHGVSATMKAYTDNVGLITGAARETFDWYKRNAKTLFSKEGNIEDPPADIWDTLSKGFNKNQRLMIEELQARGIIDTTFAQELFEAATDKEIDLSKGSTAGKIGKRMQIGARDVLAWGRAAPQAVEAFNRVLTAKMAYDLAPGPHEAKVQAAQDAVYETQFDYSDQNKPRYFKPPRGLRGLMMFKMYAQGIYSLLLTNAAKAWKGDKQAVKTLVYLTATHSAAAGLAGGLLTEPVRLLLNLFGVDDDDLEREMSNLAANTLGEDFGDLLMHGAPRAVGIDLSSRVGLNNLMLMDVRGNSAEEKYQNLLTQFLGPAYGGIALSFAKAMDYYSEGETLKAAKAAAPKFIRDVLGAYEEQTRGLTSRTGEKIGVEGEYNAWDALMRGGLGFTPARTARAWERRVGGMAAKQKVQQEADNLRRRFVNASQAQRMQLLRGEIREFNQENPVFRLEPKRLWQSVKQRMQRERQQVKGYYVDPKQQAWLREQVAY